MTTTAEARAALVEAKNVLVRRRQATTNAQEKTDIDAAIEKIDAQIGFINQMGLLQAAATVSEAAGMLQAIVATARLGPFDRSISDLESAVGKLSDLQGQIRGTEALPKAASPAGSEAVTREASSPGPAPTAPPANATTLAAQAGAPKPIDSKDFGSLQGEYQSFFDACTPRPEFKGDIAFYVTRLTRFRSRYEAVGRALEIPWQFIGIIHGLEGSFNFNTHLHNGDPLTARTVNVPAGRPKAGNPPFAWEDSAQDALVFEGFGGQTDWSVPRMLFRWEAFNGFGYRPLGIPSPYLWSFSNLYEKGKFTSDRNFDPNAVSRQCGAAVMLKMLG